MYVKGGRGISYDEVEKNIISRSSYDDGKFHFIGLVIILHQVEPENREPFMVFYRDITYGNIRGVITV
jgi:hypothetical protein